MDMIFRGRNMFKVGENVDIDGGILLFSGIFQSVRVNALRVFSLLYSLSSILSPLSSLLLSPLSSFLLYSLLYSLSSILSPLFSLLYSLSSILSPLFSLLYSLSSSPPLSSQIFFC
jgi:hypothetical protein